MGLLNYTTKIDPDKTAQEIAKCLSMHGASAVLTEYSPENSYVSAISFQIKVGEQKMGFRLPCDWKPVFAILTKNAKIRPYQARYDRWKSKQEMQAVRTAWRIVMQYALNTSRCQALLAEIQQEWKRIPFDWTRPTMLAFGPPFLFWTLGWSMSAIARRANNRKRGSVSGTFGTKS